MNNITLKQLRYFESLARHGHFGLAAEASAISQPALSMQIKELEQNLGAALFERGSRGVLLTGLGEAFAGRVREILRAVDELGDMARATDASLAGRLRLGVIPTIAPYLLPRVIGRLTQTYPDIDLHLRETQTQTLITELLEGRLDAALVALPVSEPLLDETALFTETFMLVRPNSEADEPVPNPERLREMRLLLLEEGHCFRDQALAFCNLQTGLPREMLEGSSLATLVQMVGAGIGVTLVPEMALPVETRSAPVAVARFRGKEPTRTIGMIWRKSSPMIRQLQQVAALVKDAHQS